MGSPLGPTLANVFMGHHESRWLHEFDACKVVMYRRYVDDIFCVFDSEGDADKFYNFINQKHPNIRFTFEREMNGRLPFLDTLLEHCGSTVSIQTYHKPSFTGLYTNFLSFTPLAYKVGLIRCLLYRAFRINNSWLGFHQDVVKIHEYLQKNCFPKHLLEKITRSFINQNYLPNNIRKELPKSTEKQKNVNHFRLPYIGKASHLTQKRLQEVIRKCCKDVDIRFVFIPLKIGSYFSTKDMVPRLLKSHVVYRFVCLGCNAKYIGFTTRHLGTRVAEHLNVDRCETAISQHLRESVSCKALCNHDCFAIINHGSTKASLKIKEALHIAEETPELNALVRHDDVLRFM